MASFCLFNNDSIQSFKLKTLLLTDDDFSRSIGWAIATKYIGVPNKSKYSLIMPARFNNFEKYYFEK